MASDNLNNTIEFILKQKFGLKDVRLVRHERRMTGDNFLAESESNSYHVKASRVVNQGLGELEGEISAGLRRGKQDFFSVEFIKSVKGFYAKNLNLEDGRRTILVSKYINGLNRYKDVSLNSLRVSLFNVVGQLHFYLSRFTEQVSVLADVESEAYRRRQNYLSKHLEFALEEIPRLDLDKEQIVRVNELIKTWPNWCALTDNTRTVIHGSLATNVFLDTQRRTVILDFDDIHIGSPIEDLARLVAACYPADLKAFLFHCDDLVKEYNQASGLSVRRSEFLDFLAFVLLYELVECIIEFDLFAEYCGRKEILEWINRKIERITVFLEVIK